MNKLPPGPEPYDDADERYRRASALDPSRPGAAVRRAVLEHAAQVAAARTRSAAAAARVGEGRGRGWTQRWWRPAAFAGVAAVALAGLMLAPHGLAPPVGRDGAARAPAAGFAPSAALAPSAAPPAAVPPSAGAPLLGRVSPLAVAPAVPAAPPAAGTPPAGHIGAPVPSGAAVRASTSRGSTAPAERTAIQSLARAPAQGEGDGEALRRVAASGDLAQLQSLQPGIAQIDARDARGRTALMLATLGGHAASVSWLLAHGADPNAADADGMTPLQVAVADRQPAIAAALRSHGAR
jgi:Ankyrin repeats (3 copies)